MKNLFYEATEVFAEWLNIVASTNKLLGYFFLLIFTLAASFAFMALTATLFTLILRTYSSLTRAIKQGMANNHGQIVNSSRPYIYELVLIPITACCVAEAIVTMIFSSEVLAESCINSPIAETLLPFIILTGEVACIILNIKLWGEYAP